VGCHSNPSPKIVEIFEKEINSYWVLWGFISLDTPYVLSVSLGFGFDVNLIEFEFYLSLNLI